MPSTAIYPTAPTAEDALDAVVRSGGYEVPVACPSCGWSSGDDLVLRDRYQASYPPGPRGNHDGWIAVVLDDEMEPVVDECGDCGEYLAPDIVVLRDRKHRCELAGVGAVIER